MIIIDMNRNADRLTGRYPRMVVASSSCGNASGANPNEAVAKLSTLIAERDRLLYFEKPVMEAEYNSVIGKKRYESFDSKMKSLKVIKRLELTKAFYTEHEIEEQIDREFDEWESRAGEMKRQLEESDALIRAIRSHDTVQILGAFYEEAIGKIHPEIYPDSDPVVQKQWTNFEDLCSRGLYAEAEKLFHQIYDKMKDIAPKIPSLEYLLNKQREVKHQITVIRSHFPFNLDKYLKNKKWITERLAELEEEISETENQTQFFSGKLCELQDKVRKHC